MAQDPLVTDTAVTSTCFEIISVETKFQLTRSFNGAFFRIRTYFIFFPPVIFLIQCRRHKDAIFRRSYNRMST